MLDKMIDGFIEGNIDAETLLEYTEGDSASFLHVLQCLETHLCQTKENIAAVLQKVIKLEEKVIKKDAHSCEDCELYSADVKLSVTDSGHVWLCKSCFNDREGNIEKREPVLIPVICQASDEIYKKCNKSCDCCTFYYGDAKMREW